MLIRHQVIDDLSHLAPFRDAWNHLLHGSDADPLFMSYEWITTWWRHVGDGDLLVYLLFAEDRLVGIAPMERRISEGFRQLVPLGTGNADYVDFILDPDHAADCVTHLFDDALPNTGEWDVLYLPNLVAEKQTTTQLAAMARRQRHDRLDVQDFDVAPYLDIDGTWEDFRREHIKKRLVKDTERQERRLTREFGAVQLRRATTRQEVEAWFDLLVRHHKYRRDDVKDDFSMFNDDRYVTLYRDLARQGLDDGSLHFSALYVGDEIAALHLGFVRERVFYYLLPVFDDAYARYSPGRILTHALLDECFANSIERFDFGYGDEAYKYEYTSTRRTLKVAVTVNDTLRGNLASMWFNSVRPTVRNSAFFMDTVLPKIKAYRAAAARS